MQSKNNTIHIYFVQNECSFILFLFKLFRNSLLFIHFFRVQKLKFHGEDQSVLGDSLLRFAAIGIFAYSTFNIVVGALSVHRDPKNLLILATGGISIIQVCINATIFLYQSRNLSRIEHDLFSQFCKQRKTISSSRFVQKLKSTKNWLSNFGLFEDYLL